jgi:hypothetical protein
VKVSPSTAIGSADSELVCAIVSTCAVSIVPALPLPLLELEPPELLLELLELLELPPLLELDVTSDVW